LVAPVPPIRLDEVGREDLAGVEGEDRDHRGAHELKGVPGEWRVFAVKA
jgi:hypothetical protein